MKTRLFLIRHGETSWNRQQRYLSFTDIGLNKKGKEQGRMLSQRLRHETFDAVYASDMKRTKQFASLIFRNTRITTLPEFREMNFGIFEGKTYDDIMKTNAAFYQQWTADPFIPIPHGEGLSVFIQRIRNILTCIIAASTGKTVGIVTHAGPIKVLMCDFFKLPIQKIVTITVKNASVQIIDIMHGHASIIQGGTL